MPKVQWKVRSQHRGFLCTDPTSGGFAPLHRSGLSLVQWHINSLISK